MGICYDRSNAGQHNDAERRETQPLLSFVRAQALGYPSLDEICAEEQERDVGVDYQERSQGREQAVCEDARSEYGIRAVHTHAPYQRYHHQDGQHRDDGHICLHRPVAGQEYHHRRHKQHQCEPLQDRMIKESLLSDGVVCYLEKRFSVYVH